MAVQSPPYALQNGSHTAALFRQAAFSTLLPRAGIVGASDFTVAQQATPNMTVTVAPGRTWMAGSQVANVTGGTFTTQAAYFGINDAAVTLTIAAANATNPRIDIITAAVNDQQYSGASNNMTLTVTTGTAAASPVAPTGPNNSITLAQVRVNANVTSITNSAISNVAWRSSGLNAVVPIGSQLERDFLPNITEGMLVYRLDTNHIEVYDGSAWQTVYTPTPAAPTFPNPPGRRVVKSGGTALPANVWTAAVWEAGSSGSSGTGMWSAGSPTRLVCTQTGRHSITAAYAGCTNLQIRVNASGYPGVPTAGTMVAGVNNMPTNSALNLASDEVQLTSGDYVEVYAYSVGSAATGGSVSGYQAHFAMTWLGT